MTHQNPRHYLGPKPIDPQEMKFSASFATDQNPIHQTQDRPPGKLGTGQLPKPKLYQQEQMALNINLDFMLGSEEVEDRKSEPDQQVRVVEGSPHVPPGMSGK